MCSDFLMNQLPSSSNSPRNFTFTQEDSIDSGNRDVKDLVMYTVLSALGTTFNIFQISALIIQKELHHTQNAFLANQAISNMVITTIGFPSICIGILSGVRHSVQICYWKWFSGLLNFLNSSFNYLAIFTSALINKSLIVTEICQKFLHEKCIMVVIVLIWLMSGSCIVTLAYFKIGPNVCERNDDDDYKLYLVVLAPLIISLIFFFWLVCYLNFQKSQPPKSHSRKWNTRNELFKSNSLAFFLFLCMWLPFVFAVTLYSPLNITSITIDKLLTMAETYSCIWALLYAFTNPLFGQAFSHNVKYFCFKSNSDCSKSLQEKPGGSVRVHIGMETRIGDRKKMTRILSAFLPNNEADSKVEQNYL